MKWLIGQYLAHLPPTVAASQKQQLDQLSHRTERLFTQFVKALEPHYRELNPDLAYQAKAYLDQLNSIIRVNRDDVAHGRAARVDRQLAFGNLAIYPTLLSITRELADTFVSTKCTI